MLEESKIIYSPFLNSLLLFNVPLQWITARNYEMGFTQTVSPIFVTQNQLLVVSSKRTVSNSWYLCVFLWLRYISAVRYTNLNGIVLFYYLDWRLSLEVVPSQEPIQSHQVGVRPICQGWGSRKKGLAVRLIR